MIYRKDVLRASEWLAPDYSMRSSFLKVVYLAVINFMLVKRVLQGQGDRDAFAPRFDRLSVSLFVRPCREKAMTGASIDEKKLALRELISAVIAGKGFVRLASDRAKHEGRLPHAALKRIVDAIEVCERVGFGEIEDLRN